MSRDGTLAFAAVDTIEDYWTLPIDANAVSVTGPRTQIMKNSASDRLALSLDGTTLFYCSHRGGQSEIRSRDLRTGKETSLVSAPDDAACRRRSTPDGTMYLYHWSPATTRPGSWATTSGAPPREISARTASTPRCRKMCSKLLYILEPDHHTYRLLDIASGQSTELVYERDAEFRQRTFSPDGQWVAVTTLRGEHLLLVPVRDSKVDEKETITLGRLNVVGGYQMVRFSPDGKTIYYMSPEDGHACIYAQRLSANRQPAGAPVVVSICTKRTRTDTRMAWGSAPTRSCC